MNLTAAIAELQARGCTANDTRCTIFLNDAKNDFESFYDWPWLEATATGTAPLSISDLKNILYVVDTTQDRVLFGTTANEIIMQQTTDIDQTGPPVQWWLNGTYILEVFPKNTTNTLSVRYTSFTSELAGTDTPTLPPRYHNIWIDLAMVRAYNDADQLDAAQALQTRAYARLGQLVTQYEVRNRQHNPEQYITGGGDW